MNLYEIACLVSADASEEEAKKTEEQILSFLQDQGGLILAQSALLRKNLSYPIKKQRQAFLSDIIFKLSAEKIAALEAKIKSVDGILRHLLLTKTEQKSVPEKKRRMPLSQRAEMSFASPETTKEKKIELKDIDQKLEEILEEKETKI